jgi:hypothetical protein
LPPVPKIENVGTDELLDILKEFGFKITSKVDLNGIDTTIIPDHEDIFYKKCYIVSIRYDSVTGKPFCIGVYREVQGVIKFIELDSLWQYLESRKVLRNRVLQTVIRCALKDQQRTEFQNKELHQDKESVEKKLRGKVIMRVGIPSDNKAQTINDFYANTNKQTQIIIVTEDGNAQTLTSQYIHRNNYRDSYEYPLVKTDVPLFAIHEACHAIAIPIAQIIFHRIYRNTNIINKEKGIYDQSFTLFTEMLVEQLAATIFTIRGKPSSVSFNYGISISRAVVYTIVDKVNFSQLLDLIFNLARETHQNYSKQINTSSLIVQKASNLDEISPNNKNLYKKVDKQIVDLKPHSDSEVSFDLNSVEGMTEALFDVDYETLSNKIVQISLNDYQRSIFWEKEKFASDSIWSSNFITADSTDNSEQVNPPQQYNEAIVDGLKIWYNSLTDKEKMALTKHIFNSLNAKAHYEKVKYNSNEDFSSEIMYAPQVVTQLEFYSSVFKYFESSYRYRKQDENLILQTNDFGKRLSEIGLASIM